MRLDSVTPGLEVKGRLGRQEGVEWVAFHVRGVVLPEDQERDLYIAGDRITLERLAGAETVVDGGWLVPGLVDVHTHPGAEEPGDPLDEELLRRHGLQYRDAGVTLLRVPGSAARLPAWFGQDDQLPRVFGAGPWLAAPGGYFPGWGRQVEVAALPELAVEEAAASGGWCKLIGDWGIGEGAEERQEPTVPPEVLGEVVRRVHAAGGRVAVHSQHGESGATAVAAGVDSLEHGMHLATERLDTMARQGTALVPTMLSMAHIPEVLARNSPPEPLRSWVAAGWERHPGLVRAAYEAGVMLLAGTDSIGGERAPHGRVAQEIRWLARAGVPAETALAGGSWVARRWLGLPGLEEGAPADIVAYATDPRQDLGALQEPVRVILRGRIVR
jgi:imidazolonepropionase-like amidohydrolase